MNPTLTGIKQRFGIIGNSALLNRAIDITMQVAPTDLSVLITGESGSGKEVFSQIIHALSSRKHGEYIAVNCGAIPDGTIDSELFGHEKGAFTGAIEARKGYFEVANGGTIFLDEVGELPMSTQARLLRVLESGEFIKVGSSKVQKTDVRIVAATNVNIPLAIKKGKFREDLYYRLNTIPIRIPSLRERKEDIYLLFRKFSVDLAEKYSMPPIKLSDKARELLENYRWPGNIRQLKNIAEQISVIEEKRELNDATLLNYLPEAGSSNLPVIYGGSSEEQADGYVGESDFKQEKEMLYKILFEMRKDIAGLKKVVSNLMQGKSADSGLSQQEQSYIQHIEPELTGQEIIPRQQPANYTYSESQYSAPAVPTSSHDHYDHAEEVVEESLSLADKEKEFIVKALDKHRGRRKNAAKELGISERTLYRKIKEYNIK